MHNTQEHRMRNEFLRGEGGGGTLDYIKGKACSNQMGQTFIEATDSETHTHTHTHARQRHFSRKKRENVTLIAGQKSTQEQ